MPSLSREGERHRDRAGDLTPVLTVCAREGRRRRRGYSSGTVPASHRLLHSPVVLAATAPVGVSSVGPPILPDAASSPDEGSGVATDGERRVRQADGGGKRRRAAERADGLAGRQVRRQPQAALRRCDDQEGRDGGSNPGNVEPDAERPAPTQEDAACDRREGGPDRQLRETGRSAPAREDRPGVREPDARPRGAAARRCAPHRADPGGSRRGRDRAPRSTRTPPRGRSRPPGDETRAVPD
jgi:hypothetical protein